jgi:hypothetical protein
MWLIRLACIVMGIACIVFGPMAVYKGFQVMKSGNIREIKAGLVTSACGAVIFLLGFAMFYFTFTF